MNYNQRSEYSGMIFKAKFSIRFGTGMKIYYQNKVKLYPEFFIGQFSSVFVKSHSLFRSILHILTWQISFSKWLFWTEFKWNLPIKKSSLKYSCFNAWFSPFLKLPVEKDLKENSDLFKARCVGVNNLVFVAWHCS